MILTLYNVLIRKASKRPKMMYSLNPKICYYPLRLDFIQFIEIRSDFEQLLIIYQIKAKD